MDTSYNKHQASRMVQVVVLLQYHPLSFECLRYALKLRINAKRDLVIAVSGGGGVEAISQL